MPTRRTLIALVLAALACASLLPAAHRSAARDDDRTRGSLASAILDGVQAARATVGTPPLAVSDAMARIADARAERVARAPDEQRLRGAAGPLSELREAGVRVDRAQERIFLMRRVLDPARFVLEQWSAQRDSWRVALGPEALSIGIGSAEAEDGWLVVIVIVAEEASPRDQAPSMLVDRSPAGLAAQEARTHALANDARRARGLHALAWDERLAKVARAHSRDLCARHALSHEGLDGSRPQDRVARAGIAFHRVAENVASSSGHADPAATAVSGWLASPGHRANLLDADVTHAGIGVAVADDGTVFITHVFTKPKD